MLTKTRLIGIMMCTASLSACMPYNHNGYGNFRSYTQDGALVYPENGGYYQYDENNYEPPTRRPQKQVVVPETYHVGRYHSPPSHKSRDRQWVSSQNPSSYTIELADGESAAQVAGKLHKAPKNDRRAQLKYYQGNKTHYKGLYGSYPSYDAARKALDSLPADLKNRANIKTWSSVQSGVQ